MDNYLNALEKPLSLAKHLPEEIIPLTDALYRITTDPVTSPMDLPAFSNSAMDGFAVHARDTQKASPDYPITLTIRGSTAAGDVCANPIENEYSAWEIMTGAPMPAFYDAVVPVENVKIQGASIVLTASIQSNANIRHPGEDFQKNATVLPAGHRITPADIMALSALGMASVKVRALPKIAVICTGKEIVNGSINNSNGPYLKALLAESHVILQSYHVVDDTPALFETLFQAILQDQPDMILTTGGVSAGKWDFIPDSLQKMGMTLHFHKLSIQPAKPVLCGSIGSTWIVGLPGNPISVAVSARFVAIPLLRQLQSLPEEHPEYAQLTGPVQKKPGFRVFFRGRKTTTATGQVQVEVFKEQQSFKIRPLLDANCWIVLDETQNEYQPKDMVSTYEL